MATRIKDRTIRNILFKVALENKMDYKEVETIYLSYFKAVKAIAESNDVKGAKEEDIDSMKTNINIPGFGKFYMSKPKAKAVKRNIKNNKKVKD